MSESDRFLGCAGCAMLAWFVGLALNVPVWRDWMPGDRTDMAVTAFFTAWLLTKRSPK